MTGQQWDTLIAVLVPLCMALTAMATAITAQLRRNERQHRENAARLDKIEEKLDNQ